MSKFQSYLLATCVATSFAFASYPSQATTKAAEEIASAVSDASDNVSDTVTDTSNKANIKAKEIKDSVATKAAAVTAPTPPEAPTAPVGAKTDKLKVGDIEITKISASAKSADIDVYLTAENTSKTDDGLSDAETTLDSAGVVLMKKDADGKLVEAPIMTPLVGGQSVTFASGTTFLRIKGVKKAVKEGDVIPLMLHFRRAPNAALKVAVTNKSSVLGGLFGGDK